MYVGTAGALGMSWQWNEKNRRSIENGPDHQERARKPSTGVKHVKPTMSGFSHGPADKVESLLQKLNLRSTDPLAAGGGTGKGLTGQDVAAAFGFELPPVPSVEKYLGKQMTREAVFNLAFYKHTGDSKAFLAARRAALHIMVGQALEDGWNRAVDDDNRPSGIIISCAIVSVLDVCHPQRFIGLSGRQMAAILELPSGHVAWQRKWKDRYEKLRAAIQDLEIAADAHIHQSV